MQTIASEFDEFVAKTLPSNVPAQELDERRLTFYAGAACWQFLHMQIVDMPDAQAVVQLAALDAELFEFVEQYAKKKA